MERLTTFYRKVRPDGPGWQPVAAAAPETKPDGDLGTNLLCTALGTAVIWLTLPAVGAVIFGDYQKGFGLLAAATACAFLLFKLTAKGTPADQDPEPSNELT